MKAPVRVVREGDVLALVEFLRDGDAWHEDSVTTCAEF
jgi:hypothetical protein